MMSSSVPLRRQLLSCFDINQLPEN